MEAEEGKSVSVRADLCSAFANAPTNMKVTVHPYKFDCHSVILCLFSKFFQKLYSGKDSSQIVLDLSDLPGGGPAFEEILAFCNGSDVVIGKDNVMRLLAASRFLEMPMEFVHQCENIWRNVLSSLHLALPAFIQLQYQKLWRLKDLRIECRDALSAIIQKLDVDDLERVITSKKAAPVLQELEIDISADKFVQAVHSLFGKRLQRQGDHKGVMTITKVLQEKALKQIGDPSEEEAVKELWSECDELQGRGRRVCQALLPAIAFFSSVKQTAAVRAAQITLWSLVQPKDLTCLSTGAVLMLLRPFLEAEGPPVLGICTLACKYLELVYSELKIETFKTLLKFSAADHSSREQLESIVSAFLKKHKGLNRCDIFEEGTLSTIDNKGGSNKGGNKGSNKGSNKKCKKIGLRGAPSTSTRRSTRSVGAPSPQLPLEVTPRKKKAPKRARTMSPRTMSPPPVDIPEGNTFDKEACNVEESEYTGKTFSMSPSLGACVEDDSKSTGKASSCLRLYDSTQKAGRASSSPDVQPALDAKRILYLPSPEDVKAGIMTFATEGLPSPPPKKRKTIEVVDISDDE